MTKSLYSTVVLASALTLCLTSSPAPGAVIGDTYEVEAYGGWYSPQPPVADSNVSYGVRLAYNVTENLALAGELGFLDTSGTFETYHGEFGIVNGTVDYRVTYFDFPLIFHFKADERWTPAFFVAAGFAVVSFDVQSSDERYQFKANDLDGNSFTMQMGLALRGELSRRWYAKFVGQTRLYTLRDEDKLDWEFTAGLGLTFGR